jgi:hypothetical protein
MLSAATRDGLGKTELPEALVVVWNSVIADSNSRPAGSARTAVYELLRVAANLCNDNGMFIIYTLATTCPEN